jgi:hypothetical protein
MIDLDANLKKTKRKRLIIDVTEAEHTAVKSCASRMGVSITKLVSLVLKIVMEEVEKKKI